MNDKWEQYKADKWDQYHHSNFNKSPQDSNASINSKDVGRSLNDMFGGYESGAERLGKNIAVGLTEAGRNLADLPFKVGRKFGITDFEAPKVDYQEGYGIGEPTSMSDELVRSLAQYAPAILIPGMALGKAGEAISVIPKVGSFLSEAASQAIPQALYGATQNESATKGALEGGLGSLAGSAIGKGVSGIVNSLRPSQVFKTPLTNKELAKSFRQAEGTNTDLGNVIQNPKLQRLYENKLPKITGEASLMMQKTGKQIVDKGEALLKKMLGDNPSENVAAQLTKKLKDSFEKHQSFKNNIYNAVDDLASKENLNLNLSSFANEAKKYMSAIEDTNILKHEPDAKAILNKITNYTNPVKEETTKGLLVDKFGKPLLEETKTTYPTLKEANILKGKLYRYSKNYAQSSDPGQRNMASVFKGLYRKLKNDINSSIDKYGSDTLKEGYKVAEENYAKNFSPFLDKDIYKFIAGNADPETIISKFITNSKTSDLGAKLSKLAEKLSKPSTIPGSEQSNLLAYGYLARALDNEGNFNPSKFATLIKNLGSNQLKALFPDKALRKEVLNYKSLVNKNTRSLNTMFNPLTGQVNTDIAPNALANIVGGLSGLLTGGAPGAIIGTVAGPVVTKKIADFATKKLTDPVYRRKFINSLIANKKAELPNLSKTGAVASEVYNKVNGK